MKKSILALLFLLLLLIISCVYQKTYTLYALTTEDNTTIVPIKKAEMTSPKKEQPIAAEMIPAKEPIPILKDTPSSEDKEPIKEITFLEKVKTTIVSTISPNEKTTQQRVPSPEKIKKESVTIAVSPEKYTDATQKEEKEVVDYLHSVLSDQKESLQTRNKAQETLNILIKRVLEERSIAIENMEKVSLDIDKQQQKRLEKRETMSQNITEEKGK